MVSATGSSSSSSSVAQPAAAAAGSHAQDVPLLLLRFRHGLAALPLRPRAQSSTSSASGSTTSAGTETADPVPVVPAPTAAGTLPASSDESPVAQLPADAHSVRIGTGSAAGRLRRRGRRRRRRRRRNPTAVSSGGQQTLPVFGVPQEVPDAAAVLASHPGATSGRPAHSFRFHFRFFAIGAFHPHGAGVQLPALRLLDDASATAADALASAAVHSGHCPQRRPPAASALPGHASGQTGFRLAALPHGPSAAASQKQRTSASVSFSAGTAASGVAGGGGGGGGGG